LWEERVGACHIHTYYSDGDCSVEELLCAAESAGLDFAVITDHDSLAAQREGWQGVHKATDLIIGAEITPHRKGHVLALGVTHCAGYGAAPGEAALDGILEQGGFCLVAHPGGLKRPSLRLSQAPWHRWDHPAIRGMEIWSYIHSWIQEVHWWRFAQAHPIYRFPERHVKGPHADVLRLWDTLGRVRPYAGIAGLDCHTKLIPLINARIFEQSFLFRTIRNHVFIPAGISESERIRATLDALSRGRLFIAHDILADSRGTQCYGELPDGDRMNMGEERPFQPGIACRLKLPHKAEITWVVNGEPRLTQTATELTATPLSPGVHRFEATLDGRPWLYTNPFYLR
jgi:PHP domain